MTNDNENNSPLLDVLLDRKVLCRSDESGVWFGTLVKGERLPTGGHTVVLASAAKVHEWTDAAATSGLAVRGPGNESRICPDVDTAVVKDCCEVLSCTAPAIKRFESIARWDFPTVG